RRHAVRRARSDREPPHPRRVALRTCQRKPAGRYVRRRGQRNEPGEQVMNLTLMVLLTQLIAVPAQVGQGQPAAANKQQTAPPPAEVPNTTQIAILQYTNAGDIAGILRGMGSSARIVEEERSNRLILSGTENEVNRLLDVISRLDVESASARST